jgi:hypothetical protein
VEEQEAFDKGRVIVVDRVKESGDIGVKLKGGSVSHQLESLKEEVSHKRKREAYLCDPEDEVWDEKLYIKEHGHWTTNGKGHMKGTYEGKEGILVPARLVWKIKKSTGTSIEKDTKVQALDDIVYSDNQSDDTFDVLAAGLNMPAIVGATLDSCFGGPASRSMSQPANDEPEAPVRTPQKASNPFQVQFSFAATPPAAATPKAATPPGSAQKPVPKTAGRKAAGGQDKGNANAKPPRPGKKVVAVRAVVPHAAASGSRGRPGHDNVLIGKQQLKQFGEVDEMDETFFGTGYKAHKQFLQRVKSNLELRLAQGRER